VVLARELSLSKIKEIHDANPDLELEAFIHGALCVSYSGQCYLSCYIGGRSANRGECAQPCRKKYTVEKPDGTIIAKDIYALCLKDFNASKHIGQMVKNGILSFKIEGRLKEKNYVKNVTAFYRQELDKYSAKISSGKSFIQFCPNPEKSFNRGFTDYFLEKRKDCFNFTSPKSRGEFLGTVAEVKKDCFKIKTDKEIHAQDGLVINTDGCLVNKCINGFVYPNRKPDLKIGDKVFRNLDFLYEKELEKPVKRQIGVKIQVNTEITAADEDGVQIKLPLPAGEIAKNLPKMKENFIKQFSKTGESDFYISEINIAGEIPFMPVSALNVLRRRTFELLMEERLRMYNREVQKPLNYVPYYKSEVDYRGNVLNSEAQKFYEKCGCTVTEFAPEKSMPEHPIELMRTKHCIKYALNMCGSPEKLILKDEFGKTYPLVFDCKNCEMAVTGGIS